MHVNKELPITIIRNLKREKRGEKGKEVGDQGMYITVLQAMYVRDYGA